MSENTIVIACLAGGVAVLLITGAGAYWWP